jgi:uncharacterized protein involved in response to NO
MTVTNPVTTEIALQRLVTTYVFTGLLFLLLPGTFLGVWNLVSISGQHSLAGLSPSWLQAHGHAQIFGWIGTFIIGIGYYSLSKMGRLMPFAVSRGWASWALWTSGVTLRWAANITEWNWRVLLPAAAAFQLIGFLLFFATVSRHRSNSPVGGDRATPASQTSIETWMKLVMASSAGFLLALLMNQVVSIHLAMTSMHPEIPHWLDQRYLFLAAWGFPVLAVWGFNARWLPVFLGLPKPSGGGLMVALAASGCGIAAALLGRFRLATALLLAACIVASIALRVFEGSQKPAKTRGVSASFLKLLAACSVDWDNRLQGTARPADHLTMFRHDAVTARKPCRRKILDVVFECFDRPLEGICEEESVDADVHNEPAEQGPRREMNAGLGKCGRRTVVPSPSLI